MGLDKSFSGMRTDTRHDGRQGSGDGKLRRRLCSWERGDDILPSHGPPRRGTEFVFSCGKLLSMLKCYKEGVDRVTQEIWKRRVMGGSGRGPARARSCTDW